MLASRSLFEKHIQDNSVYSLAFWKKKKSKMKWNPEHYLLEVATLEIKLNMENAMFFPMLLNTIVCRLQYWYSKWNSKEPRLAGWNGWAI